MKEEVTIAGKKGSWCKASFKGKTGWVFDGFLGIYSAKLEDSKNKSAVSSKAKEGTPKFSDYPAEDLYTGPKAELVFDEESKTFKSRFERAYKNGKPTFAGRYIVASWGCGSGGCNTGGVIDAKTGKAILFPVGISSVTTTNAKGETEDYQDLEYSLKSRLMKFSGSIGGASDGIVTEFYELKDGKFVLVSSKPGK